MKKENKKVTSKKDYKWQILGIVIGLLVVSAIFLIMGKQDKNIVIIETSEGNIKIELYPDKAPITVENFKNYVESGFYENTVFHRVIEDFMIQGGGFEINGSQKPTNSPIKLESNNGLKNEKGTIAMARTNIPDSATSQFFINLQDNDFLNYGSRDDGYAVFGKVIGGMDLVEKIGQVQTTVKRGMQDWPVKDVVIERIYFE